MTDIREKKMFRMVCGFAFDEQEPGIQYVVLIHKNRGPAAVCGRLNGIGGHIEEGETLLHAMVREFEEETGVATEETEWGSVPYVRLYGDDWEVSFFRRFGHLQGIKTGSHSVTDELVHIVPSTRLADDVVPNLRWLIPMALDPSLDPDLTIQVHDVA